MKSKELRIAFMGTPEFAVESLRQLFQSGYNIVAVITTPDRRAGRGLKVHESEVKKYASAKGLNIIQPENLKDSEWIEQFKSLDIDLAIVVAFRMLPKSIWSLPKVGTFNLHSSLLPKYRGAAPINWAIIKGERESGVTTFMLNEQIDTGEILLQRKTSIADDETAGQLHDRLMTIGAELVIESVELIASGNYIPKPQNDSEQTFAPKIFREDCKIAWNELTINIFNKIRGLSPYPAAWFDINESSAKIFNSHYLIEKHNKPTGTVESDNKEWLRVSTLDGWIYIDQIQLAGKKSMSTEEFLRGNRVE